MLASIAVPSEVESGKDHAATHAAVDSLCSDDEAEAYVSAAASSRMSSVLASPCVKQILITSRPSYFATATHARPDASTRDAMVRASTAPGGGSTHNTASDELLAVCQPRPTTKARRRAMNSTERSMCWAYPDQPAAASG